jgi:hypothetical protein
MDGKRVPMWARIAIVLVTLVAAALIVVLLVGGLGVGDGGETQGDAAEQTEQVPDDSAQVFEFQSMSVEYRGTQDVTGNALVSFAVTNRLDVPVRVMFEGVVANDQFDVQALGGSNEDIAPGDTGAASISFGVPTQTTLEGTEDLTSVAADVVLVDATTGERVATERIFVAI